MISKTNRILFALCIVFSFLNASHIFCQTTYAEIYHVANEDVRQQMDQNKRGSAPILNNIFIKYEIIFGGISSESTYNKVIEILSSELEAKEFSDYNNTGYISFVCSPLADLETTKNSLQRIFVEMNTITEKNYVVLK